MNQQENFNTDSFHMDITIAMVINSFVCGQGHILSSQTKAVSRTRHKPTAGWHAWFKNHNVITVQSTT